MYTSEGDKVYVTQADKGERELFLTVHKTDSPVAPDEQAKIIARMLNAKGKLETGERDALKYFIMRVDALLPDEEKAAQLHRFMNRWWSEFKDGVIRP